MRAAVLGALLLCACGSGGEGGGGTVTENQVERLSTPRVEKHDPSATARLQPIAAAELEREGLLGAGCGFTGDSGLLLVAARGTGLVRIQDRTRRLVHSAPVDGTGGFLQDGEISVSVGRTAEVAAPAEGGSSWLARVTVTNRRTGAQQQLRGTWTCGS